MSIHWTNGKKICVCVKVEGRKVNNNIDNGEKS